ncbi:MAG TPA: MarR family transcriptional regulator [Lachnospiraceae bacterium]|nr:MarR family transcriptional regulator [Lachnospiraceae bacterium]
MMGYVAAEMKRFNYLTSEIDAAYHEAALKLGLTDSAMMVLYAICNHGEDCPLNDIIHLSGASKQTVNSALRKLENMDVIYLENYSGRKKNVCLTDKGKVLVKDTVLRIIEIENSIFDSWTEEERNIYISLTEKYLSSFKEKIRDI